MAELTGQTFAGYEIVAKLGEGGMGAVYKAKQPILNRFVALKTMAAHLGGDKEFVARFQREAASAATLSHPNVVGVHTAGEVDGTHYIVMEFVEGESVRKRLDREGRIPPAEALAITIYVAQALQHAWNEAKLIHRDIKPDNIFISKKGEVKVGDLGLAKSLATEGTEMTATGMAMGSPHYISPEQATGIKDIDFRTDIYSLGCTLYHMLTGQTPYKGDSAMIVMMKHVNDPPPAIFKAWPQCPMPMGMLVGRMLAKDRNTRPKSYEQLIADLFAVSEKLSVISSQPSAVSAQPAVAEKAAAPALVPAISPDAPTVALQPSARPKSPVAIYAAAGVAVLLALGGLFLWSPWSKPSTQDSNTPSLQQSAVSDAFVREVAALPAEQQVARVVAKLKELNPGYDGQETHKIENGIVTELKFLTIAVADISPARALRGLRKLQCEGKQTASGTEERKGLLVDLSPVAGLSLDELVCGLNAITDLSPLKQTRLTALLCGNNPVSSLSPLAGMPLRKLQISNSKITDLSALRGMSLEWFVCDGAPVSDLAPLAGMPLKLLDIRTTRVADLSPLRDMPLAFLRFKFVPQRDTEVLRSIKTLEIINSLPAAEFWKKIDEGKMPSSAEAASDSALRTPESAIAPDAALKQLGNVYQNAVGAEMIYIPPGKFMLGSTKEERDWAARPENMNVGAAKSALKRLELEGQQPPRRAVIRNGFWLGRTEVTIGQWRKFAEATGYQTSAERKGAAHGYDAARNAWGQVAGANWRDSKSGLVPQENHAVTCISWEDATAFCKWLTEVEHKAGRLPSVYVMRLPGEAEWEYACRGGREGTRFWWGDAREDGEGRLNWCNPSANKSFISVVDSFGERGRNGFGLADMLGNAWEWCLDNVDPAGAHVELFNNGSTERVLRGGAFESRPLAARCASRDSRPADTADFRHGFRICLGPDVVGSAVTDSAIRTPQSAIATDAGWQNAINLLPLIDPQKDAVKGTWYMKNGELMGGDSWARVEIPYQPPSEYDFRIVFTRQTGHQAVWQMLTGGGRSFNWCIAGFNGTWFGFEKIGGKGCNNNPSSVPMEQNLENGRRYTSEVQVRKDGVKAFLDGRFITEWKTDYRDMSPWTDLQLRTERTLGVGACPWVIFHRIEVREITGKGTLLRKPSN